ncbi:MAG: UDP-GlcNAc--UDP-phosphate GlcNAc-1-phosphate transferase [Cyclobacteriaceae bacterium]
MKYNIIDRPNERSSHQTAIIRGAGVLIPLASLYWFQQSDFELTWFIIGLIVISGISFLDDIHSQPIIARLLIHAVSILLLFHQVNFFDWHIWFLIGSFIVCVGTLSAFNFMDGINGITGLYAAVGLGTFCYIDQMIFSFTNEDLILTNLVGVVIFLFYNFRKKAKCFAGDIGSVALAFIQIFFLLQLIQNTRSLLWVFLFLLFGVDSIVTIVYRILRKENIFSPHRTHAYQYLANEWNWDHRTISLMIACLQVIINTIIIYSYLTSTLWLAIFVVCLYVVIYLYVRHTLEQRIAHSL